MSLAKGLRPIIVLRHQDENGPKISQAFNIFDAPARAKDFEVDGKYRAVYDAIMVDAIESETLAYWIYWEHRLDGNFYSVWRSEL